MEQSPKIYDISLRYLRWLMLCTGLVPSKCFECVSRRRMFLWLWRAVHCTCSSGLILLVFVLRILQIHHVIYKTSDVVTKGIDVFGYYTLLVVHFVILLESTWKAGHYERIFAKFEQVRLQLWQQLAVAVNCARIRRYSLLLHGILLLYVVLFVGLIFNIWTKTYQSSQMLLLMCPEILLHVKLVEFMLLAAVVLAFQRDLYAAGSQSLALIERRRYNPWQQRRQQLASLFTLQEVHAQLWRVMRQIEYYFMWSLPVLLLKRFFDWTMRWYWFFFVLESNQHSAFKYYCMGMVFTNSLFLYVLCKICSACEESARMFRSLFLGVASDRRNVYLNASLRRISLQLMHEPMHFTAGGFVDVNMNMFGQFLVSTCSYVVILIQFRMSV